MRVCERVETNETEISVQRQMFCDHMIAGVAACGLCVKDGAEARFPR